MPIWYVGVTIGNAPRVVFDWIEEAVHRLHAQQQIALARFTIPKGSAKRYMFLRVDVGTREEAEDYLDHTCRLACFYADSEGKSLRFDGHLLAVNPNSIPLPVEPEIWHFTRGVHLPNDKQATWRVPVAPPRQQTDACDPLGSPESDGPALPRPVDPAALLQAAPTLTFQADSAVRERYHHLLLWLSAAGQGSWETFVRVCNQLGVSGDSIAARRVMRRLILLGHVELGPDGRAWSATPVALVQLSGDPTRAFWCGQRSESLRRRLEQVWTMTTELQPETDGPPRWLARVGTVRDPGVVLRARGLPLRWEGSVAENLAGRLPDLDHWQASLFHVERLTTPERGAQRWHAGAYQDEPTFRVVEGQPQGTTGLYRLRYGHEKSLYELTGFLDAERGEFLRGDWYGLRFLAASRMGTPCVARWLQHGGRSLFLVPQSCRWPLLYERVLVLASGLLPVHDGARLCYLDVPHDLAATLTRLLGVTLL